MILDADGLHIGSCVISPDDELDELNAAFIIRAVNCHDELLAACQDFIGGVYSPEAEDLLLWLQAGMDKLNPIHFDSQSEYGRFMRELRERVGKLLSEGDAP